MKNASLRWIATLLLGAVQGPALLAVDAASADISSSEPKAWWTKAFTLVHGVEVSLVQGRAEVTSKVRDSRSSGNRKIASGSSELSGVQFGLGDSDEGFAWSLTPSLFFQSIRISDFSGDISQKTVEQSTNIPYIESDVATGARIEKRDPNSYKLNLTSLGLVLKPSYATGFDLTPETRLVFGSFLSATIAELSKTSVKIGDHSKNRETAKLLNSFGFGLTAGLRFPHSQSTIKLGASYLKYPKLELPKQLEFRDRVDFNESKQAFERRRVFIKEVELSVMSYALTYGYDF